MQETIVLIFSFVDNVKISTDHPCIRADLTDASELLQKANLGLIALWSIDYSNPPRVPCRQQGEARSEGELLVHRTRGQPETAIPGKHDPPTRVRRRQVKEIKVRPKHIQIVIVCILQFPKGKNIYISVYIEIVQNSSVGNNLGCKVENLAHVSYFLCFFLTTSCISIGGI